MVVLDLAGITQIDENSALELRAAEQGFWVQGRELVLSGLGPSQLMDLRAAGVGDMIDAHSVCPDLELAIARGMVLLDSPAGVGR